MPRLYLPLLLSEIKCPNALFLPLFPHPHSSPHINSFPTSLTSKLLLIIKYSTLDFHKPKFTKFIIMGIFLILSGRPTFEDISHPHYLAAPNTSFIFILSVFLIFKKLSKLSSLLI